MIEEVIIDKDSIPYSFELELNLKIYTFVVKYNEEGDYFTIDLYEDDKPIIFGEKIVLGRPLFLPIMYKNAPIILPLDFSYSEKRVNFENLGENIKLYFVGDDNDLLE